MRKSKHLLRIILGIIAMPIVLISVILDISAQLLNILAHAITFNWFWVKKYWDDLLYDLNIK